MQQINSLMALEVAKKKLALPTELERKPESQLSALTLKMMFLVFTRMTDLFQQKAINKGFIIFFDQEKNVYSDTFELWCRKLEDLQPEDFKRAMINLEKKAEDDYRLGGEMWPPSYAEFRALAFPNSNRDSLAHRPFPPLLALEDQTEKARRYQEGLKQTTKLLELLEDPKPEPRDLTPAEIADNERLNKIIRGEL